MKEQTHVRHACLLTVCLSFLAAALFCALVRPEVGRAATYTVSTGQAYSQLEALRQASMLAGGDTVVLTADDASLTAPLYTGAGTITLSSSAFFVLSPAGGAATRFLNNVAAAPLTLAADTLSLSGFHGAPNGGAVLSNGNVVLSGSGSTRLTFASNTAGNRGGAIAVYNGNASALGFSLSGGAGDVFSFVNNSAQGNGGAVYAQNTATLSGGTTNFQGNSGGHGGAIYVSNAAGTLKIEGGTHTFTGNSAQGSGGALYADNGAGAAVTLGTAGVSSVLDFTSNTAAGNGGAIAGGVVSLLDSNATFTRNVTSAGGGGSGGAIYGEDSVSIVGGLTVFTQNQADLQGGAIFAGNTLTITGGVHTFSANSAQSNGGAINSNQSLSLSGSAVFLNNTALGIPGDTSINGQGGAAYAEQSALFRAAGGDITFQGNRDNMNLGAAKANALYMHDHVVGGVRNSLTLAAENGHSLFFYDPVTSRGVNTAGTPLSLNIQVNPQNTDSGVVVFDGNYWRIQGSTNPNDYKTILYGDVTHGYGTLGVQNGATVWVSGDYAQGAGGTLRLGSIDGVPTLVVEGAAALNGSVDIVGYHGPGANVVLHTENGITGLNLASVTVNGKHVSQVDFVNDITTQVVNNDHDLQVQMGLTWNLPFAASGTFTVDAGTFSIGLGLRDNVAGSTGGNWDGRSLVKDGPGTLILAGNNAYTGSTTIRDGTLEVTGLLGGGVYGGAIDLEAPTSSLAMRQVQSQTFSGVISGQGSLAADGPGMLTLSGANTYTGSTTVAGGVLQVTGALGANTNNAYTGSIALAEQGVLLMNQAGDQALRGEIRGAGTLAKYGAGTLTVANVTAANFNGKFVLGGGTLALSDTADVGNSSGFSMAAGTVLDISGLTAPSASLAHFSLGGPATLATGAGKILNLNSPLAFDLSHVRPGQTYLAVTGTGAVDVSNVSATLTSTVGVPAFRPGDAVVLVERVQGALAGNQAQLRTALFDYAFRLTDNQQLVATLTGMTPTDVTKVFSEGRLGGSLLLTGGSDLIASRGMASAVQAAASQEQSLMPFAAVSAHSLRHNTGSHIDASGTALVAGLAWRANALFTGGVFVEAGRGAYNSYNSFSRVPLVQSDGTADYVGGGLLARVDLPHGFFGEASARMGSLSMRFNSEDLRRLARQNFDYADTTPYFGAHASLGYTHDLSEALELTLAASYLWTRHGESNMRVSGIPLNFEAVDSHRVRGSARLTCKALDTVAPYVGIALEQELAGQARVRLQGVELPSASLFGTTGMAEVGINWKPTPVSPFSVELALQGYTGQREGVSGSLQLKYEF